MAELTTSDSNDNVRVHATLVLIEARDRRAATSMVQLLGDAGEYGTKYAVAFVPMVVDFLDDSDRRRIADAVAERLDTEDEYLSAWARRALLELRDHRGLRDVWEFMAQHENSGSANRWHVMLGLQRWGTDIEPSRLRRFLHDPDPFMRAAAANVAGVVRMRDLVEDLESLLDDDSPLGATFGARTVAVEVSRALDFIAGKDKGTHQTG
jgi:HEAT repeat protein